MQSAKRTRREISRLVLAGIMCILTVGFIGGCDPQLNEKITAINNQLASIDNRVTNIDNSVTEIDNSVTEIDNRVTNIDNRVTQIREGVVDEVMDEICLYNVNVVFYDWEQMDKGPDTNFGQFAKALDTLGKGKVENGSLILTVPQSRSAVKRRALSDDINNLARQAGVDVDWVMESDETCAFDTQLASLEYVPTQVEIEGVDKAEVEIKLVVDKLLEGSYVMLEPMNDFRTFAYGLKVTIKRDDGNPFTARLDDPIAAHKKIEITIEGEVTGDSLNLLQQGMRVYAMTARVREVGGKRFSVVTYSQFDVRQPRAVIFGQKIPVADPTNQPACYPGNDISDARFRDLILQVSGRNCV